ncbi:MAG TPA: RimK family alpha-L-glutamate ligase, partial [Planctomycetaceae bacterium]|nr:RimK family alpha-L-glutamate ligase [Planctomycetaceae bacterium]
AITRSRDKLRTSQILAHEGIDMPVTGFAHSTKDISGLLEIVGGTPVVIKLLEGTQGIGVILAETRLAAEAVIEAFRELDANILVQEYIAEAEGTDLRCFVVGGEVVAAIKRISKPGEYRSNLHRGGTSEPVVLSEQERQTAIRAAHTMGLNVAGVDLLPSKRGPLVMEVNSSPGLEGIETTTGIDVAGEIIKFLEENAGHPRSPEELVL